MATYWPFNDCLDHLLPCRPFGCGSVWHVCNELQIQHESCTWLHLTTPGNNVRPAVNVVLLTEVSACNIILQCVLVAAWLNGWPSLMRAACVRLRAVLVALREWTLIVMLHCTLNMNDPHGSINISTPGCMCTCMQVTYAWVITLMCSAPGPGSASLSIALLMWLWAAVTPNGMFMQSTCTCFTMSCWHDLVRTQPAYGVHLNIAYLTCKCLAFLKSNVWWGFLLLQWVCKVVSKGIVLSVYAP